MRVYLHNHYAIHSHPQDNRKSIPWTSFRCTLEILSKHFWTQKASLDSELENYDCIRVTITVLVGELCISWVQ